MGVRIMRLNEGDKVVSVTITKISPENGVEYEVAAAEQMPIGMITELPQNEELAAPVEEAKELPKETVPVVKPAEPKKISKNFEKSRKTMKQKKEKVKILPFIKSRGKTLKRKKTILAKKKPFQKKKRPMKKLKTVKLKKLKIKPVKKLKERKPSKKGKMAKTKKLQKKKITEKRKPRRK